MADSQALSRRALLGAAVFGTASLTPHRLAAKPAAMPAVSGWFGLDAAQFGLVPGATEDQSRRLRNALAEAARRRSPLLLAPGRYRVAGVELPDGVHLTGVPGSTRLVSANGRAILTARGLAQATLTGLSFDGLDIPAPQRAGLVEAEGVAELAIAQCAFAEAGSVGLVLTGCGGNVRQNRFGRMRESAVFSLDSRGLAIEQNRVEDCGNNGIQIWRSQAGDDNSLVRANSLARIRADAGGDGPNGNGISLYRAGGVIIEGNTLRDCAMSFIRNNSGSGVQILGNQGRRCGEVALYCEFAFEGAIIANNLVEDCAQGADITNLDHGGRLSVFSGNVIRRARRAVAPHGKAPVGGIGVHVEAEAAVTGNVIEDTSEIGISLGWSWGMRNLAATGNIVRRTGIGVSVSLVPKERNALVANNVIAESTKGAVVGTEYGKPVTGDLTKAWDTRAAGVRVEGNAVG
ncbi:MAG: TIGR03808 family TAT-translocated repetitive protein [Chelatococcus sp.]|nr:MAG: TIGR03808 family TAT-translocated repetitive protein [Chelatococcus sp.]